MKKTAFIAIVGKANVGKSTLLNALLGEKVSIVSNKRQTTRNEITGILTEGENQFVFMDTPGLHNPRNKLGQYMVKSINNTVGGVDAAILVVEAGNKPSELDKSLMTSFDKGGIPALLVINKTDVSNAAEVAQTIQNYSEIYEFDSVIPISAMKNKGIDIVKNEVEKYLYESEWFFPEDTITDQPERQIVAEIIREKLLRTLNEEVPHGTAVVIETYKESSKLVSIQAQIICEKASHKGIIIGKDGATLKLIGSRAREDIEKFLGTKVYLELWVKVKENWRDSTFNLANFGYSEKDFQ